MRSSSMVTTIYMPLLNEGTDVWRPVNAEDLGGGPYRIAEEASDDEEWAFASGATVILDRERRIVAAATP